LKEARRRAERTDVAKIRETNLHVGRQHAWAYEIPATFIDDSNQEHNVVLVFKAGKPTQAEIDGMIALQIGKIEAEENEEFEIEPET